MFPAILKSLSCSSVWDEYFYNSDVPLFIWRFLLGGFPQRRWSFPLRSIRQRLIDWLNWFNEKLAHIWRDLRAMSCTKQAVQCHVQRNSKLSDNHFWSKKCKAKYHTQTGSLLAVPVRRNALFYLNTGFLGRVMHAWLPDPRVRRPQQKFPDRFFLGWR